MSPVHIKTRTTKKGDRRYLCYYRMGGGREAKTLYAGSFHKKAEAQARRDLIAGELAAGRDPRILLARINEPPVAPLGLLERWDSFMASRIDVGVKAQRQYRNARDRWLPVFGEERDPVSITPDDVIAGIADFFDEGEGLKPSTIGQYVSNLALVLDFCGLEPNAARSSRVRLPRADRAEKAIPGNETWFAMRRMARKRSRLCLRLEEACALRVSEATDLEWGDLDFVAGMVRIRRDGTKTAAGRRWVPVPLALLDEIATLTPLEDRQVHGKVLGVKSSIVYADLGRACVLAGTPSYGTHVLRHRRISLWLRHGIDPVQVARWSGHSKPSESLNTYGHVILDPLGDEWRTFWLERYDETTRRTPQEPQPREAPVRHGAPDA